MRRGWDASWNRRRAGSRARRKYARQRKAWLRRHRVAWLAATAAAAVMWFAFWGLMSWFPGDQSWATAAFAGALIGALFALRQSPPVAIATWEAGALGEEQTAKQLRRLERDGWVVLHDLANGSANFDHVVLGPAGVFCLNSKWSSYRLEESETGRLVGRHEYDEALTLDVDAVLKKARGEAAALSRQIQDRCGQRVWVTPVVVWWGQVFNGGKLVDGVGVVEGKRLVERLRVQRRRPVPDFDAIVQALRPGRHRR